LIQKIIYYTLKNYCRIAVWFYFSRWQIHKLAPIPDGPVIFVANHQNAFLDAILMICSMQRAPWSLTRANVFDKPLAKKFLTSIQMLPVYRFRDGFSTLRKNDKMIDSCVNILSQGKSILIFGEGNHNYHYYLRDLQKGFARIALAAEEKHAWKLGVKIVPVGIQYDSHDDFRSPVLVTFGNPILVNDYLEPTKNNQENLDILLKRTADELKTLILNINPDQYEERVSYLKAHRQQKKDLYEQLKSDQALVDNYTPTGSMHASKKPGVSRWLNPFFLYQYINHLIPALIIQWVLKNKVSDPQFTGSLKYVLGMVLSPIFYIIQTGVIFAISGSALISGIYFLSLPISVILRR